MMSDSIKDSNKAPAIPTQREVFWYWLKLGFINFGGPAGQIAIMHHDLVEKKGGYLKSDFCMLLTIAWFYQGQKRSN